MNQVRKEAGEKTVPNSDRIDELLKAYNGSAPYICIARARAITESYGENHGQPAIIKKARAFRKICETVPAVIYDHELIVGSSGAHRRSAGVSPEISWQWIKEEIETIRSRSQDPYFIEDEDLKSLMDGILPLWEGRSVEEAFLARVPEETARIAVDTGIIDNDSKWRCAVGEITPDYQDILLPKGINGILEDARNNIQNLDLTRPEDIDKRNFYLAVIECAKGIICLGERYAREAEVRMVEEEDLQRRHELAQIAENCRHVPANPPRNFWEAVQMVWIIQLGNSLFENSVALNLGRFDQYMFPLYERDLNAGRITEEKAQELMNCLWIKLSEWIWFVSKNTASFFAGYAAFQNLTIGGKKADGTDGTNAVSYMCLEAAGRTGTHQPSLSVRIHPDCPHAFMLRTCELVKEGTGFPAIHNDRIGARMLANAGLPPKEAMDWSNCGCVVPHSRKVSEWTSACNINLAAAVEFVFTNGVHRLSGKSMSLKSGSLDAITDFETFKEKFFDHLGFMIKHAVTATLTAQQVQAELAPRPYFSSYTEGCLESGRDVTQGGARYHVGPVLTGIGIADAVNSLAAVNDLVFDRKLVDLATLNQALENNWEGFEILHTRAKECAKFGNDNDYADRFAVEISNFYHEKIQACTDIYGSRFNSAFMGISNYIPAGRVIGATPCGRKATEQLTEGCSPHAGTDVTSPTAAMKSTARINHDRHSGGTLLNIKLSPESLRTRGDLNKLAGLIRGYFELDAFHVQFNVFDRKTLLAAQETPEDYRNLLVRVAGYSARFVTLSREVQDAILQRTSYESV
ncbi:MAG: hypothetical protein MI863_08660 [Desulfobacterales bacterium]|nr:hypothetical protein [Desulfobacterales bacterium]